jgi:anti-sigma factor (TIGR02949 family)
MKCAEVSKFIYVYLDGEFEPRELAEFEEHVRGCPECRDLLAFERAFHALLRSRIERPTAPAHLRARIVAALDAELARDSVGARLMRLPLPLKAAPALAAAAVAALLLWPTSDLGVRGGVVPAAFTAGGATGLTLGAPTALGGDRQLDDLMSQTVAVHENPLPAEVEGDRTRIEAFAAAQAPFSAPPPFRDAPGLRLVGARQARYDGQPAVLYTYQYNGKRVSVLQFADGPGADGPRFRRAVFTDRRGPYNLVLLRDRERGVTSSLVSDADERDLLELIPASYQR